MPTDDNLNASSEKEMGDGEAGETELVKCSRPPGGNKQPRKRNRQYYNSIREQMEFYFGDANLSKDRFLKQLIDRDPYVPLDVFLTFNKMKSLAKGVEEIAKSLTNSQLLELDGTQQKVRRKTPLPAERDVDDKTLYVESIPPTADHDWVKQNFSRFGNVAYVSLPRYTKSRKIKEFGFVEFEKAESVAKAVKAFQEFKGVLSVQNTDPAELKTVKAYIKEHSNKETLDANETDEEKQGILKKKRENNPDAEDDEPPSAKKIKTEDESSAVNISTAEESKEQSGVSVTEGQSTAESTENELPADGSRKKRRKKKKKPKKLVRKGDPNKDAAFYELKVLPKRDWKKLRNKYLNLQREKISEIKRKAWKVSQQLRENSVEGAEATSGGSAIQPTNTSKPSNRKLRKINMNFYGAGDADTNEGTTAFKAKEAKNNPALERAPLFKYEPGLIVEVAFLEPCVAVKEFKADMRQYASVKYVDVKEGAMRAYLRLESADAAADLIRQISSAEYKCNLLSGDEERDYWRKIEQDREMKLNKKVKVPQRRGREKVKKLLAKHTRFDDEDKGE